MRRTSAVDRPDFHAWRAYRAVVNAETAAEQAAVFQFHPEGGRSKVGVWIHGGPTAGIRIGAVHATAREYTDRETGLVRRGSTYSAVADAVLANGTVSPEPPIVTGLDSRSAAAALLYGRWIERRARVEELTRAARMIAHVADSQIPGVPAGNLTPEFVQ